MYQLSQINIFPIKSLGGIALEEVVMTDRGLAYDRRWMLVDPEGNFITQRSFPEMALFQTKLSQNGITISAPYPALPDITLSFDGYSQKSMSVQIWGKHCEATICGDNYDAWFTQALGQPCHLVYMPEPSQIPVDPDFAKNGELTSFSDGYPTLIIGAASLQDLNSKLEQPVKMDRFRPNLVFSGGSAFCEDNWKHFQIGSLEFFGVKLCSRCVMTTIDQQTSKGGKEPLKTLATYRKQGNKVMFGQNLLHRGMGTLKIGDEIALLT